MKNCLRKSFSAVVQMTALVSSLSAADIAPVVVTDRGPNETIWSRTDESGHGRSYVERGTGLNFWNGKEWAPSRDEIVILPSGFGVATQAQHMVMLAPNANTAGAVNYLTHQSKRLRSHVLGMAYECRLTGRGVMIGSIKDSTGVLVADNQVLYPDAFDTEGGFRADLRYTFTKSSLEQDVILVEQPPHPSIYGILPENCVISVFSEFVEAPEPEKETSVLKQEEDPALRHVMVEPDVTDEKLMFGLAHIGQGAGFRLGGAPEEHSVQIAKSWEIRDGRQLLIEKIEYSAIEDELQRLGRAAAVRQKKKPVFALRRKEGNGTPFRGLSNWASFLPARPPKAHAGRQRIATKRMARAEPPKKGFVLDYVTVINETNYTFRGDTTYYFSSTVQLYGTTVIEGGAVFKYPPAVTVQFNLNGGLDCRTSAWRPLTITARDDNTVGETISSSTGAPSGWYGLYPLACRSTAAPYDLHDIRIRHTSYGFVFFGARATVSHAQVGNVLRAVAFQSPGILDYRNILFYDASTAFLGQGLSANVTSRVEHATIHRVDTFVSSTNYAMSLTNCLLAAVTNNVRYTGSNNETNLSDSGIFQTVASGARYLSNGSLYRNSGTTNITPSLLKDLRQRTTYPPTLLASDFTASTVLFPQAMRDTDIPDLGYHYDCLDFYLSGLTIKSNATVIVTNGACVGIDFSAGTFGLKLDQGGTLISEGTPLALNRFVRTHAVQELASQAAGSNGVPTFADAHPATTTLTARLRFTDLPMLAGDYYHLKQSPSNGAIAELMFRDSEIRGGYLSLSPSNTSQTIAWTNSLFERVGIDVSPSAAMTLNAWNNLHYEGWLNLQPITGSSWTFKDSLFDATAITQNVVSVTHDYNGYRTNANRLTPNGANDIVTNAVYETGALGRWYLPTNSPFLDVGSRLASAAGLYHYTSITNSVKETNSTVNIGYHYVALNGSGQPVDSDGDGVADYIEDANGNGTADIGEADWQSFNSPNGLAGSPALTVFTPLR
jgi:hypothetical protein